MLKTKETIGKLRKTLENIKVSRVYPGGPPGFTQESLQFSNVFNGFLVVSFVFILFSTLFQPITLTTLFLVVLVMVSVLLGVVLAAFFLVVAVVACHYSYY